MRLLVIALCVAVASAEILSFQQLSNSDEEWALYKKTYNKIYPSDVHEGQRRKVWEDNLQYIRKHNLEADMNMHSYRLGVNEYADLTAKEFNALLGYQGNESSISNASTFIPPENLKLPSTIDWRNYGYVTAVKNQGYCGSCWAFSTTGAVEGQHFRKTRNLVSLSEQNLVDCSSAFGNHGCSGGFMTNAFRYIMANGGIDTERSYPYEGRQRVCRFNRAAVGARVTGYVILQRGSEAHLQSATASVGPITVGIDAHHHSIHLYKSGVYDEPRCSSRQLNHAVLVVGYGTYGGRDYWLVKNSWGASWGQGGYIWMSRNKGNQCGIATFPSYPLV